MKLNISRLICLAVGNLLLVLLQSNTAHSGSTLPCVVAGVHSATNWVPHIESDAEFNLRAKGSFLTVNGRRITFENVGKDSKHPGQVRYRLRGKTPEYYPSYEGKKDDLVVVLPLFTGDSAKILILSVNGFLGQIGTFNITESEGTGSLEYTKSNRMNFKTSGANGAEPPSRHVYFPNVPGDINLFLFPGMRSALVVSGSGLNTKMVELPANFPTESILSANFFFEPKGESIYADIGPKKVFVGRVSNGSETDVADFSSYRWAMGSEAIDSIFNHEEYPIVLQWPKVEEALLLQGQASSRTSRKLWIDIPYSIFNNNGFMRAVFGAFDRATAGSTRLIIDSVRTGPSPELAVQIEELKESFLRSNLTEPNSGFVFPRPTVFVKITDLIPSEKQQWEYIVTRASSELAV